MANLAFMQSLLGTLPLQQLQAPQALDAYTQSRIWTSSSADGSMLLEAWAEPTSGGSQVNALEFDPASASYHVLGLDPGGPIDRSPAIVGGANGRTMVLWASQAAPGGETAVVGQVFSSGGQGGARWNYRHGNGTIGQTALAAGQSGFLALWSESAQAQNVLLAQQVDSSGGPIGNPTVVSSTGAQASAPAVAAGNGGYLTAWSDDRDGSARVYGELVTASGQAQTTDFPISDGSGVENPKVTWDGSQYWVSWYDGRAGLRGAYDAYVQAVNSAGGLVGSNVRVSDHRMAPMGVAPRVLPQGAKDLVVFAGQAIDDQDTSALAPSAVYGSLLTPGATPSAPFAMTSLDSSRLVDAQDWGSDLVMLSEEATGSGQTALDWSLYRLPGASGNSFTGAGMDSFGSSALGASSLGSSGYGAAGYGFNGTGMGYLDTLKPGNPYLP